MASGFQRDGLKASEVFQIRKSVEKYLADGEDRDIAYSLACREIIGVAPETFKGWKPDIFKLIDGEKTPADSLLSGSLEPAKSSPASSALVKRVDQLGTELDVTKADHARLLEENEKLKKQLAANVLGEEPAKVPEVKKK
jgi:hypothetical protein